MKGAVASVSSFVPSQIGEVRISPGYFLSLCSPCIITQCTSLSNRLLIGSFCMRSTANLVAWRRSCSSNLRFLSSLSSLSSVSKKAKAKDFFSPYTRFTEFSISSFCNASISERLRFFNLSCAWASSVCISSSISRWISCKGVGTKERYALSSLPIVL